jgi:hypothetical protein
VWGAISGPPTKSSADQRRGDFYERLDAARVGQHQIGRAPRRLDVPLMCGCDARRELMRHGGRGAAALDGVASDTSAKSQGAGSVHEDREIERAADLGVVKEQDAFDDQDLARLDGLTSAEPPMRDEAVAWWAPRLARAQPHEVVEEALAVERVRHVVVEHRARGGVELGAVAVVRVVTEHGDPIRTEGRDQAARQRRLAAAAATGDADG